MSLPVLVSFWHGPMSWLEALCIASMARHGHRVDVYAYEQPQNFPVGANWRDAAEILPREQLVFYKGKGTPAVFSDRFRLELLRGQRGVYVDLDLYLLAPIEGPPDYLMAWERPGSVNSAVLHIPADSALLSDLFSVFSAENRPLFEPHLSPLRRLEVAARRLLGEKIPPENMQYGATGPMALTYFVKKHGLADKVLPSSTYYPVPYEAIPRLMEPGSSVQPFLKPETRGIHLWRSQFTDRGRAGMILPPPGSAMAALCAREGIEVGPT